MNKIEQLLEKYCPDGVEFKELGKLGKFYGGLSGKTKNDFTDGNAKFITFMNIFKNISVDTNVDIFVKINPNEKQNKVEYGDVLFTGSSENPNECGMSSVLTQKNNEPLYLNSFCFGFRLDNLNLFLPDFLKYLFREDQMRKKIGKTANGVTRFNVSKKLFAKIQIPIPPIEVQQEIVKILDTFTQLEAELEAELEARKKQYEYYKGNLMLNTEGEVKRLENITEIFLGLTYTPKYVEEGVKFISAKNTSNDFLDLSDTKFISVEEYNSSTSNAKPKRGDILFTRVGSNLGHPVIVDTDEDLCIFVSLGYLRVNKEIVSNSYLKHWMNTTLFWDQVKKNVHGAGKFNLNTGWLKKFEINLPSLQKQQEIVDVLDTFDALVNDISSGLPAEIEARKKQYEYYREKLLTFKELKK